MTPGPVSTSKQAARICMSSQAPHMAIKACRHGTFLYSTHDTSLGRSLDLYGEWCEDEIRVLSQLVKPGDLVLDIGASLGTHTIPLAQLVSPSGLVIAVEPIRALHQMLCGNLALNGITNVSALHAAAGQAHGQLFFTPIDPACVQDFGSSKGRTEGPGEAVDVLAIDELGLQRCGLIKIDAGGMEAAILAGARETLARCKPALLIDASSIDTTPGVLAALEAAGYKAFWQLAPAYNNQNYFGNQDNLFVRRQPQSNLVAVPVECPFSGLLPAEGTQDDWKKAVARLVKQRSEAAARRTPSIPPVPPSARVPVAPKAAPGR